MRKLILSLTAAVAALGFAATVEAQQVKWRFQAIVPVNTFFYTTMVKAFSDNAKLMSGGRIEIQPFGVGEIVPAFKIHEEVAKGTVDAGWTTAAFLANADLANGLLGNFPGGPSPETWLHWYYVGGGKQLWQDYRREVLKVHSMMCGLGTTEFFAHSHKPVRTKDDLKGLKHRTTGVWAQVLKEVYGAPTAVISSEELFGAFERKVIDSLEFAGPGGNLGLGYHKVAKYIIIPGVHQPASPVECVINMDKWNALADADKQVLEAAAELTTYRSYALTGQEDFKAMPQYRDNKNEFIELDPALVLDIQAETRKWLEAKAKENEGKGNPWMGRILKHMTDYQATFAANSGTRAWDKR